MLLGTGNSSDDDTNSVTKLQTPSVSIAEHVQLTLIESFLDIVLIFTRLLSSLFIKGAFQTFLEKSIVCK